MLRLLQQTRDPGLPQIGSTSPADVVAGTADQHDGHRSAIPPTMEVLLAVLPGGGGPPAAGLEAVVCKRRRPEGGGGAATDAHEPVIAADTDGPTDVTTVKFCEQHAIAIKPRSEAEKGAL